MASCSSGNGGRMGLDSLMKHIDKDASLMKDSFEPAHAHGVGFEDVASRPLGMEGDFNETMVDDFMRAPLPPPDGFQFRDMRRELGNVMDRPPAPSSLGWKTEFERFQQGPMENQAEFERAFIEAQHKGPANWANEFQQQPIPPASLADEFHSMNAPSLDLEWSKQFDSIKESLKDPSTDWDQEFQQVLKTPGVLSEEEQAEQVPLDLDWSQSFQSAWKNAEQDGLDEMGFSDFDDFMQNQQGLTQVDPDPVTGPQQAYHFETENPYLNHPNPFEEGVQLLTSGGSLSQAALAFEAVVQRDPTHSEAWMRLGMVQAENEKEHPAIAALQHAVKQDRQNHKALMSLAVSYTNEGLDHQALATLERWINLTYPSIGGSDTRISDTLTSEERHERVSGMFIEAARQGPVHRVLSDEKLESIDPDVQIGLGVLFYNANDYSKAVDCFNSALSARPQDYRLWNRLGATLANSGRSEEAIDAYYRALEINPSFVRGRYNLGVSCINIGCYKEAAEHLLGALSMHIVPKQQPDVDGSHQKNVSQNLWDTLRRTFILMGRRDLSDKALVSQNVEQFRQEFEF